MPTILREGPYRFYFHSHESNEPPHIHVDRERFSAKFWLASSVTLARNVGYSPRELRIIHSVVVKHQTEFVEAWHEYFGSGN
ncbi:MAG TPA: DUF4160 domain-containing protein [Bacteroidota bacterium]